MDRNRRVVGGVIVRPLRALSAPDMIALHPPNTIFMFTDRIDDAHRRTVRPAKRLATVSQL